MNRVARTDWLETFVAIVEHGGFIAAAEAVHRSQSRISAHIAALERDLGARLFDRRHRPVELTDAGVAFLDHARAVLAHLDAGQSDVDAVLGLTRGHVVLGSYPSASAAFVPGVLHAFRQQHPNVQVDLVERSTMDLTESLAAGEVNLALRPCVPVPDTPRFTYRPIWREWLVAVIHPDDPLAGVPAPLPLELVAERPIITIGGRQMAPPLAYDPQLAFHQAALEPRIVLHTEQPQTLVNMVRAGIGLGVTNQLAAEVSETSGLVVSRVGGLEHGRAAAVFWDDCYHQSVATRALLRQILAAPIPPGTVPADAEPPPEDEEPRPDGEPAAGQR